MYTASDCSRSCQQLQHPDNNEYNKIETKSS